MSETEQGDILVELVEQVEPARPELGVRAVSRLARSIAPDEFDNLAPLVGRLAAMGGTADSDRTVLVCGADHGTAPDRSAAGALEVIASGEAAVCSAARQADAQVVVVDCGVRGELGPSARSVLGFRIGDGTRDFRTGPAMTPADARACLHTGIALSFSLADTGLDLLGLGGVGAGQLDSTTALTERLVTGGTTGVEDTVDCLARVGGFEIGVLAGVIVGASSLRIPVLLDGAATSAAALVARALCPATTGYLIATHAGGDPAHGRALRHLGLSAFTGFGVARGEGTGAALAMEMVAGAARIVSEME